MLKKIFLIVLFILLIFSSFSYSMEDVNSIIDDELKNIDINGFSVSDFKNEILEKNEIPSAKNIVKIIADIILEEAARVGKTLVILVIPILLMGMIPNLSLKDDGVSDMANIASYLAISGVIIHTFLDAVTLGKETIDSITIMSEVIVPVMYSMMITLGRFISYTNMHPTVIFLSQFILLIITKALFPLIMLNFSINVTDNITNKDNFKRISSLIAKTIKWSLIFLITLFTAILSANNILSHSFDTVALKGTKFAVANFIPVVGGAISEGAESVGTSIILIKNATGISGIAGIVIVAFIPLVKIFLISLMFYILSAVSQTVGAQRIAKVLDNSAITINMIGAVVISVAFLFIISLAILLGG